MDRRFEISNIGESLLLRRKIRPFNGLKIKFIKEPRPTNADKIITTSSSLKIR